MPIPQLPGILNDPNANINDLVQGIRDYQIRLERELQFMMQSGIDSTNIFEAGGFRVSPDTFKHKSGLVGLSTAGATDFNIRIWAGDIDKTLAPFRVQHNGYMYSTRGFIGGWDIDATKLSGTGTIQGGTIIGSEIMTALAGIYPRSAMSSTGKLFIVQSNANESISMIADDAGQPSLSFRNTVVNGYIRALTAGATLLIGTVVGSGKMQIASGGQLDLFAGGTADVYVNSWARFRNNLSGRSLQQDLDAITSSIPSGSYAVITYSGGVATSGRALIASDIPNIAESQVTNLVTDLAAKRSGVATSNTSVAAYQSVAQTLTASAYTKITYTTETKDNLSEWSTTNSNFTPVNNGVYIISAGVYVNSVAVGIELAFGVFVNGVLRHLIQNLKPGASGTIGVYGCGVFDLLTTDVVDIRLFTTVAYTTTADRNYTYCNITRAS